MQKSISHRARASKKTTPKTAIQDQQAAMNASITPAKYQPTTATQEAAPGRNAASEATACDRVRQKLEYIEQEFAAGLQVVHLPAPGNNMGVTGIAHNGRNTADYDGTELIALKPKGKKGKYTLVQIPAQLEIYAPAAFIDQVSFTVYTSSVVSRETTPPYKQIQGKWPDIDAVAMVSSALVHIFGFGVSGKLEKGRNFYEHTYALGDFAQWGAVSTGGNNNGGSTSNTINVQITGQGCQIAAEGWEKRLYHYLNELGGRLTRADTAIDLHRGEYSPEQAFKDWEGGKFSLTNRKPKVQLHGGSWWNPSDESGKTTEIGTREGGKMTRVYEKGYELLGKLASKEIHETHPLFQFKKWVRIETEWHRGNGRELPLEMLLEPGKYLAGGHPEALGWISEVKERIQVMKKKVEATVQRAEEFVFKQAGPSLLALKEMGRLDDLIKRIEEKCKYPKWVYTLAPPDLEADNFDTHEKLIDAIPF